MFKMIAKIKMGDTEFEYRNTAAESLTELFTSFLQEMKLNVEREANKENMNG